VAGAALLVLAGCGGSSSNNVITVSVTPSTTVIVSQSLTLSALVSGTTNPNVGSWTCTYFTTSVDSTGKATVGGKNNNCTSDTGTIPANSNSMSVVYTAPNQVPDLTKLPGNNCSSTPQSCSLSIIITATAAANTSKSGFATLGLDSGIAVSITPATATVPTGEQQQFSVQLTNDLQSKGVTWLITQGTISATVPYPALPTCSPGCGMITNTGNSPGLYTAPSTVPTTATLTIVATSIADTTRYSIGTITIIQGAPIKFNGLAPSVVPQGASSYDIYLAAPFASSASYVTLTAAKSGSTTTINAGSGQLKVLFPIPTSTILNPSSTGLRLRLAVGDLSVADTFTVRIFDPAECPSPTPCPGGPFTFTVVPVRPTSTASLPDSVVQNNPAIPAGNAQNISIDGGYFGPNGSLANVVAGFAGNPLVVDPTKSSSRQLNAALQSSDVNAAGPGLYKLSVSSTTPGQPPPNNPSVTTVAVFPDYSVNRPTVSNSVSTAGQNPSAVDIDTQLAILAVAEPGSNQVEFFSVGAGTLTSLGIQKVTASGGTPGTPTGLSINQNNHTVAVVDYQNQDVIVFPLPGQTGDPSVTYPLRISLAGLIPPIETLPPPPLATPYSIGVDSDTNNALVAYSSSANPTTAKVGFLLDLNNASLPRACLIASGSTITTTMVTVPCVHAEVTLNTGTYPQIAMLPHSHTAFVTPGGAGPISGIDVTQASTSTGISSLSLTSGLVTVVTSAAHNLLPGYPTTVLIAGVAPPADVATSHVNFNGVFTVQSVISSTSFTYALNFSVNDTSTGGTAYYAGPNVTLSLSQTLQGISINPITRTAALADANATGNNGSQIDLLNSLDQSVTSITFQATCTAFTVTCPGAPELLGTTSVAFQPYSNSLVSYNPNPAQNPGQMDQISVSDPVTQKRYAIVSLPGKGSATLTVGGNTLNFVGGLAVDPPSNQAFVVQSGSNTIQIVNLGNRGPGVPASQSVKSAEITELQVPAVAGARIGGIPGAAMSQGTLTSTNPLANVDIFGSGFDASTQVRLDGNPIPSAGAFVSSRHLRVTIPASYLALPHRYAVDVVNGSGVQSNATDFYVIKAVDLTGVCASGNPQPNAVAIVDQLPHQGFSPLAVVTNSGCNNIVKVNINPQSTTFGALVGSPIATGTDPIGVAVSLQLGLAVVANNTDGTASILDLVTGTQKVAAVTVGTTPTGVAINEGTGAALVANTGSGTISEIDLASLVPTLQNPTPPTTLTAITIAVDQAPIAIAVDPDRGTNNLGLAVVTALQLLGGQSPTGVLDSIDIGGITPMKSTTAAVGSVSATPTGIVFDPTVSPALFYANSSGANLITSFNPDTAATSIVRVGVNPTSLAINPQTGGILSINSASQTISIIDTISNPFKTRNTYGLGGSMQFGVAIDQFTNMAVIADQANHRVLIFPMPN
jgi:DNA-binding beta-propeller fold protein YncE